MSEFKPGTKLFLLNKDQVIVREKLGEGGQGVVYRVEYNQKEYALKWYLPGYLKKLKPDYNPFYRNLKNNVQEGSPSDRFLWQKEIVVTGKDSSGFGYLMDLRPANYSEFTAFIKAREHFANTKVVIMAAIHVVEAFRDLHKKGYSYQDLNPGNFFIDKDSGEVLICDNDNVAPDGENLGVGGTPGYMAPEIILGTGRPNTNSDLFSLSVILFELFFLSHPLEGANCCRHPCLTKQLERELYAEKPVFVFDKNDHSNAPVEGVCSNLIKLWPAFPTYLQDAFVRAFTDGLKESNKRLSENEWLKVLYRLLDDAVECPHCHELNFVSMSSGNGIHCAVCHSGAAMPVPPHIEVNGFSVYAGQNKRITNAHVRFGKYDETLGMIAESKKNPGVWGIRNESGEIWAVDYPGKPRMAYEPGKTVTLINGTTITIGNKTLQIKQ